jgi:acylphosphatase
MIATKHMGASEQPVRIHAYITGRVQGVFYRAETREQALLLGVTGWVRNLADGRVEVVGEGEEQRVRKLIAWCRQGPPRSRVDQVEELMEDYSGNYDTFSITL